MTAPDSIEQADRWVRAAGLPMTDDDVRAWLDQLGVPVPVGIRPLMSAVLGFVIAAGDAGYAAGLAAARQPDTDPADELWTHGNRAAVTFRPRSRFEAAPLPDEGTPDRDRLDRVHAAINAGRNGPARLMSRRAVWLLMQNVEAGFPDGGVDVEVSAHLAQLDGSPESAVALLGGVPRDRIDEHGGASE